MLPIKRGKDYGHKSCPKTKKGRITKKLNFIPTHTHTSTTGDTGYGYARARVVIKKVGPQLNMQISMTINERATKFISSYLNWIRHNASMISMPVFPPMAASTMPTSEVAMATYFMPRM